MTARSQALKTQQDKDSLKLMPTCVLLKELPQSATVESALTNSEMLSKGKLKGCGQSTPQRKSSEISDLASISKEKDLTPYWSEYCAAISSRLWLPTVTDLPASGSTCSDSLLRKTAGQSWLSIQDWAAPKTNSPKICSLFSTTFLAKGTVEEVIKAKRLRICPTAAQKNLFRQWFGTSRLVYNETVKHLNQSKEARQKHWMGAAKVIMLTLPEWAKQIPYQVKKMAIKDAYAAFSNGHKKHRKTGEPFKLAFRSKKNPRQSCFIPPAALKQTGISPRIAGELCMAEKFPESSRDSRLFCEHGRWMT